MLRKWEYQFIKEAEQTEAKGMQEEKASSSNPMFKNFSVKIEVHTESHSPTEPCSKTLLDNALTPLFDAHFQGLKLGHTLSTNAFIGTALRIADDFIENPPLKHNSLVASPYFKKTIKITAETEVEQITSISAFPYFWKNMNTIKNSTETELQQITTPTRSNP